MELLYLYIPESAGYIFKDAEFNFSGRHQFHFDKRTRELSHKENLKAVDGSFFTTEKYGKDNIVSSISAIVGDNGAGKTSIIEFLYNVRVDAKLEHIVAWKSNGQIFISSYIVPDYIKDSERNYEHGKPSIEDFNLVYITNSMGRTNLKSMNGSYDLSTFSLLASDKHQNIDNGKFSDIQQLPAHRMMEINRAARVMLALKSKNISWELPMPKGVIVRILDSDLKIIQQENSDRSVENRYINKKNAANDRSLVDDHLDESDSDDIYNEGLTSNNVKEEGANAERFLWSLINYNQPAPLFYNRGQKESKADIDFVIHLFKSFMANWYRYHSNGPIIDILDSVIKNLGSTEIPRLPDYKSLTSLKVLKESIFDALKVFKHQSYDFDEIRNFENLLEQLPINKLKDNNLYFDLEIDIKLFHEFTKAYFSCSTITNFLEFDWFPRVSSGEFSQINIYSRLYDQLRSEKPTSGQEQKDVIIFLDEVETTIHPRLQRRIVSNLIEFFNVMFKDEGTKVHLIFASHSPILLSDIPRDQTILLKRDGKSVVVLPAQQETFSANIHSLYEHHFRMGDKDESLIGQFAFEKIRELVKKIEALDPEAIDQGKVDEIERELSVVGEPFMKHKITELLEEKMNKTAKKRFREIRLKQLKDEARQLEKEIEGGLDD